MSLGLLPPLPRLPLSPAFSPAHSSCLARLALPWSSCQVDGTLLARLGLKALPLDDMSIACRSNMSTMPAYNGHAAHCFPTAVDHAARSMPVVDLDSSKICRQYRCPSQQAALSSQSKHLSSLATTHHHQPASRPSTRSCTPSFDPAPGPKKRPDDSSMKDSETLIYHSLQTPKCISPSGGNLSDFAAQMTCLFWFDSAENLKIADSIRSRPSNAPIPRLPDLAKPFEQFRKWVYNVLSTTQVTQNVILLALLFIYRLKMSTPQIKGRAGSEYRLLTVALMLGNKFLDDNTYTNKTWAEVSCFAFGEIHVMEVEFLSNMRYNLLASKDEWEEWLVRLACFHEYYERALNLPASPVHTSSPTATAFHSPIHSPASMLPGMNELPPYNSPLAVGAFSPSHGRAQMQTYHNSATSPLAPKPMMSVPATRKRSPDDEPAGHAAKRQAPCRVSQTTSLPNTQVMRPHGTCDSSRLPPQLSVITSQNRPPASTQAAPHGQHSQVALASQHVSLPPLQPGVRAMSTVYQQSPATVTTATGAAAMTAPTYPVASLGSQGAINYGSSTKYRSPATLAPYGSSPLSEHLGPVSAGVHTPVSHTPISNSPSVYLQQRASPYKPVRHVNTLLYPPPSASLDQYHLSVPVQPNQMHYLPLGRRHDVRTGIVPDFVVYNRSQQQPLPPQRGQQGHYIS
ncbi:hypothetical protein CDD81_3676 [Ophiocordyceps australis]|uniref:Cyclin N-terminal domain-containing protein n=1 Tax=Ophiocordyceps australis TaxID=1399860 RepID=A0A2C5XVN8_9HYPO|nr:hypothetical protein CDD81_3676 [Ophiocordyceps australis]